jgi:menaquinone-dependent protoporphyrinogen oxidase
MKTYLVLYATRDGHTRRIAEHLAGRLRARGVAADMVDAANLPGGFTLADYEGAILAASVRCGKHEAEMIRFVKDHLHELENMPAAFLSVSLSEAGAEDSKACAKRRGESTADVERMIDEFLAETKWRPSRIRAVAGALMYTKYNFLVRFVMKQIAKRAGASTDTSHDHDFTNWPALDQLVDEVLAEVPEMAAAR